MICFHFTIFVVLETTLQAPLPGERQLWFAFILLSLSYWKQLLSHRHCWLISCDLLSFYYLCRTGNNAALLATSMSIVVICFHFTIFVVLETTPQRFSEIIATLWFAFILLSLSYWKQHSGKGLREVGRCDLLSFYYLCRTGNNQPRPMGRQAVVVICFHFTIFVVLETTTI